MSLPEAGCRKTEYEETPGRRVREPVLPCPHERVRL
jgi:hypothetical protein